MPRAASPHRRRQRRGQPLDARRRGARALGRGRLRRHDVVAHRQRADRGYEEQVERERADQQPARGAVRIATASSSWAQPRNRIRHRIRCCSSAARDPHRVEIGRDARAQPGKSDRDAEHGGAGERGDARPGRREIPVHQRGGPPGAWRAAVAAAARFEPQHDRARPHPWCFGARLAIRAQCRFELMIVFHGLLLVNSYSRARRATRAWRGPAASRRPTTDVSSTDSGLGIAEPFLIGEHDRGALARRQGIDRGGEPPVALALFRAARPRRARDRRRSSGGAERQIGRTAFRVEAEIDDDTIEPGAERRFRPPARRIDPDPQQGVLHDLFGQRLAAEDSPRETRAPGRRDDAPAA